MITVDVTTSKVRRPFPKRVFEQIAGHVCRREKVKHAELSFVIVGDAAIRRINKRFLQHDVVTDVITFPLEQDGVNAEIYINREQARRQAEQYHVSLKNEMTRLVVHGILHAVGYEDRTHAQHKRMESAQERYVAELS